MSEGGVRGRQTQGRVEVPGVLRQDSLQQRNGLAVLFANEETRRLLDDVEEPAHVGGARRVLADRGRSTRADVAEARELAELFAAEVSRGRLRFQRRNRIP